MAKVRVRKMTDDVLRQILAEFEQKYGMSSEDFYRRYEAGEMGDSEEMVAWASYCYMSSIPAGTPSRVKA